MGLDFMATFFSSATSLLPIFARDILHVGSEGYGFLYAAPGAGAVVAGVAVSFYSSAIRAQGRVVLLSVAAYGACTVLFGLSRSFALSLLALAGTGAADTVSMIIRQTIRQVVTPDALRGRMTSVTSVFFMGGPQLGEVEAGLVARAFGAPISVISGGLAALLATGLIGYYARGLRRYRG
jgi:MFS family permease